MKKYAASDLPEIMTLGEVADYLKLHQDTVYNLLRRGELTGGFRLGSDWRFRRADIDGWIEQRQVRPTAAAAGKPDRRRGPRKK